MLLIVQDNKDVVVYINWFEHLDYQKEKEKDVAFVNLFLRCCPCLESSSIGRGVLEKRWEWRAIEVVVRARFFDLWGGGVN